MKNLISYPCFCTSNTEVIKLLLIYAKKKKLKIIIEATSSQVNQFGGYSNKTPKKFERLLNKLAKINKYPIKNLTIGGDHLGIFPWIKKSKKIAIKNSQELVISSLKAGYKKIHIDTSYKLKNDKFFNRTLVLERSLKLANLINKKNIKLILGSDVPFPGSNSKKVEITNFKNLNFDISFFYKNFSKKKFDQISAFVIEPGMYFNHFTIKKPNVNILKKIKKFGNDKKIFFEAHSCDYQKIEVLKKLVSSNFKYLKVGPELTFNFAKAAFKMEGFENKNFAIKSNLSNVILKSMLKNPKYWFDYYNGSYANKLKLIKSSNLDRMRYYWQEKSVQNSLTVLKKNINKINRNKILNYFSIKPSVKNDFNDLNNFDLILIEFLSPIFYKYYAACNHEIK